jgi:hypothetical protein
MNENQEAGTRKRRSSEEVKGLVVEFEASGLRCSEFCRDRGMALSTLRRHLKKNGSGKGGARPSSRLVPVEVVKADRNTNAETIAGLEVILSGGRRIAVGHQFDSPTLGRLVKVLEGL